MARYPSLKVQLSLSDGIVDIVDQGFDAAIRIGALPDSSMITRTLGIYRCIACASPAYIDLRGQPIRPEELENYDCLDYEFSNRGALNLWRFSRFDEVVAANIDPKLTCNDSRVLIDAALAGRGIVQVGELKVAEHLSTGRLVRVLPDWDGPSRPLQIVFASHKQRTAKLRVVIDWLVESFGRIC